MALPRPTAADLDRLSHRPGFALVGILRIPELQSSPLRAIVQRIAIGLLAKMLPRIPQPVQDLQATLVGQRAQGDSDFHLAILLIT